MRLGEHNRKPISGEMKNLVEKNLVRDTKIMKKTE